MGRVLNVPCTAFLLYTGYISSSLLLYYFKNRVGRSLSPTSQCPPALGRGVLVHGSEILAHSVSSLIESLVWVGLTFLCPLGNVCQLWVCLIIHPVCEGCPAPPSAWSFPKKEWVSSLGGRCGTVFREVGTRFPSPVLSVLDVSLAVLAFHILF